MIKKEITLCGKQVTLAYCFATEIGYKILAEEECTDFIKEVFASIESNRMPDTKKSIMLIIAAATAYAEFKGEDVPIDNKDIMYNASSVEIGNAIGVLVSMYVEFYKMPAGEEEKKPDEQEAAEDPKNA